ncbi:MAG: 4-vinyl reductase [Candidatus Thorarchaeota archaeon]|nr:4-vinyl reductase [Candidatus Thorarchaeota archaeon]
MTKEPEIIPWWQGKLKERELMRAFFAKTWSKIGNRIAVMFPDRVRDLYYSAGRLAGLEAQKEYFKIGKQKPPGDFKGIVEFIKTALSTLIIPFGDVKIEKLYKLWLDEEAILEIHDNPYAAGVQSEEPSCYFLKGFIEAILEYLTDFNRIEYATLEVVEQECMSTGADVCRFQLKLSYPAKGGGN